MFILLMVSSGYFISDYWWLFYWSLLVTISGCFING
jgi:hypothetical protein